MQLEKDPLDGCVLHPVDDDSSNSEWFVSILGPAGTPYIGGTFVVKFVFPAQYPFKAPTISFVTKIYHPSVETATGNLCNDIVANGWGPTRNVKHCLMSLLSMLQDPNSDHFVEDEIATQLRDKPKEFEKTAKKYTKEYAKS
mmetsp:Transcript_13668/g.20663  ORF Transcript_13668/g.20663 Transcript_13668/m.20663 type:complete len:142 (+) Transcript_13668:369-794(+)